MKRSALKSILIGTSLFLGITQANAGPDTDRAKAYFAAISTRNPEAIASFYADDAIFHWVGGPLAGVYVGKDKIQAVWKKFSASIGKLDHEVLQISESGDGSAVTGKVKFSGAGVAQVKFAMLYRDGQIVSEVWEADKPRVVAQPQANRNPNGPTPLAAVPARTDGDADGAPEVKAELPEQPKLTQRPSPPTPQPRPMTSLSSPPTPGEPENAGEEVPLGEPDGDSRKDVYGHDMKSQYDAPYSAHRDPLETHKYGTDHCDHNSRY
jgi:ketosteroid isomerase-like protein